MSRTRSLARSSVACGAVALSVVGVSACAPMATPATTTMAPASDTNSHDGDVNVTGNGDDSGTAAAAQTHKSWAIVFPQGTSIGAPLTRSASAVVLAESAGSCALVDVDGAGHKRESALMTFGVDGLAPACTLVDVDSNDDALVLIHAERAASIHIGDTAFALAFGDTLALVFDRAGVLFTALALSDVDVRAMLFDRARGFASLERTDLAADLDDHGDRALHFRQRRASGTIVVDTRYDDIVNDSSTTLARDGAALRAFFVVTPAVLGHRLALPGATGALTLPASLDATAGSTSAIAFFLALDDTGVVRSATATRWSPTAVAALSSASGSGGFVASGTSADALSFVDLVSGSVTQVDAPGAHTLLLARVDAAVTSSTLRVDGQALAGDSASGGVVVAHPVGLVRMGADLAIDSALPVDAAGWSTLGLVADDTGVTAAAMIPAGSTIIPLDLDLPSNAQGSGDDDLAALVHLRF